MATRAQKVRLGIFMITSFLLLAGGVVTLAGLTLWNPKDVYKVRYTESVSGLEIGSTVKMRGVRVGQVQKIDVADVQFVDVTLALTPGTPIYEGTKAVVASIGITGLKFVELTPGNRGAAKIEPNGNSSWIKPGESALHSLTGKATSIATKMEAVLNYAASMLEGNRDKVSSLLTNADKLAANVNGLIDENRTRIKRAIRNADKATASLSKSGAAVEKLAKELVPSVKQIAGDASTTFKQANRVLATLKPQVAVKAIARAANEMRKTIEGPEIKEALKGLRQATLGVAKLMSSLNGAVGGRDRQLRRLLGELNDAATDLKRFARAIRERPSLLLRGQTFKEREIR